MSHHKLPCDPSQAAYIDTIRQLFGRWTPHAGQSRVGQAYFTKGLSSIFVQCGRKWGKTEIALYFLWRIAQTFPGSPCYFIAPFQKQAKEIVWADPRAQNFGPRQWLLPGSRGINNSEMRLNFKNGSFIKVDGSDNHQSYRGPRFKICVYEEFKDHNPMFRRAMRPNASVLSGLELFVGSPPDRECDYTALAREHETDPSMFFYQAPTWENPGISRKWLFNERKRLYLREEGDEWEREYAARFIPGGAAKIFPMISRRIVKPHQEVMDEIYRDRKKLVWILWADPAAASCFATLFLAYNPYSKKLYALDEIYERSQGKMTVKQIGGRIIRMRDELNSKYEWRHGYDEAEKWWAQEWLDNFPEEPNMEPSHKAKNDKDDGLSLIKDILIGSHLVLSDRCRWFFWEMDQYFKDKNGNIPKKNDHLIDCFRYILGALYFQLKTEHEQKEEDNEDFRGARISHDFPDLPEMGDVDFTEEKQDWEILNE